MERTEPPSSGPLDYWDMVHIDIGSISGTPGPGCKKGLQDQLLACIPDHDEVTFHYQIEKATSHWEEPQRQLRFFHLGLLKSSAPLLLLMLVEIFGHDSAILVHSVTHCENAHKVVHRLLTLHRLGCAGAGDLCSYGAGCQGVNETPHFTLVCTCTAQGNCRELYR